LGQSTIAGFLRRSFKVEVGPVAELAEAGTYIILGAPENNPALAGLVTKGLTLTTEDLRDEGFQILTHESGPSRFVIVYGRTPQAIKHGCQELVYYRIAATATRGEIDWPLNVVMKPACKAGCDIARADPRVPGRQAWPNDDPANGGHGRADGGCAAARDRARGGHAEAGGSRRRSYRGTIMKYLLSRSMVLCQLPIVICSGWFFGSLSIR
jgi:hypothetical protein